MKIREWIKWLEQHDPESELVLCDPDTGWLLPLQTEMGELREAAAPEPHQVVVYATYMDMP